MTPRIGVANAEAEPSTAPVLTWLGASMSLCFVVPMVLMGNGLAEPRGYVGKFAAYALYGSPILGYLLFFLASTRKERAEIPRMLFLTLYVFWLIGDAVLFVLGLIFGMGNSW